ALRRQARGGGRVAAGAATAHPDGRRRRDGPRGAGSGGPVRRVRGRGRAAGRHRGGGRGDPGELFVAGGGDRPGGESVEAGVGGGDPSAPPFHPGGRPTPALPPGWGNCG